jgi:hypothetical protein
VLARDIAEGDAQVTIFATTNYRDIAGDGKASSLSIRLKHHQNDLHFWITSKKCGFQHRNGEFSRSSS